MYNNENNMKKFRKEKKLNEIIINLNALDRK